ncbi:Adenosylcobinamide kinase [Aedoeadaptatus ivorii]|uniref:Adenosylcobinamide kinase n=1 Tax=Aedoeadaptatus ivorii TaxID=54006 RepID=A0A3S4Y713_9FIRM|nr:bifunctional adenosylcobinamide kinase/adenosylcobinamide-phosphate guanylyltransferase [Peptoniphilus ivorii]MDQ0507708.1 adenosylcobinamide kinase/adenosylcobinamide-phosphate guanylyltransferase [Peptoniphilus ivorii]VEJ35455.1 Adenosylcobinamide kinase [Peptoniphilus ivorii]
MIALVTGGARSGKSRFAEEKCRAYDRVLYIATAEITDEEMRRRVEEHRKRRPENWDTAESLPDPAEIRNYDAVLLDCVTLLLSRELYLVSQEVDEGDVEMETTRRVIARLEGWIDAARAAGTDLYCVSNEVGMGIVPMDPVSRAFRDCQGRVNQWIAKQSDAVYWLVSGIAVAIKCAD